MIIRRIGLIGRAYRHVERYAEILGILFKFGFGDFINSLNVEHYLDFGRRMLFLKKSREPIQHLSRAERLRMALEELGPTFIKLGQVLSTRTDLIPREFIVEFEKLQDKVQPVEFEKIRQVIDIELKGSGETTFSDIDAEPLASASIGQVHRARLHDGEDVVIKVQKPGIRRMIEVDLEIILHIALLMEKHLEGWDRYQPTKVVEEFGRTMEHELDYTIEASYMERFAAQSLDDEHYYVPKVFKEYVTPRVLTMEYVDGIKSSSFGKLHELGYNPHEIAMHGSRIILTQIFVHGFFHADPHPGNVLILPQNVICFLDMGMVGRLDSITRELIADLIMGLNKRDAPRVTDALISITVTDEEPDHRYLENDVSDFMDRHFYKPLKQMKFGILIQQLFELTSKYHLRMPTDVLMLIRALNALEGLGGNLDPEFDMIEIAAPFVHELQMQKLNPANLGTELVEFSAKLFRNLKTMPDDLQTVLKMTRQGKLKIVFEHRGLESYLQTQDRTGNRLAFAIVLASLIIGSSAIIHANIPPKWHDIPLIGLAGFLIAGVMGFWLLISILRSGRM